MSASLVSGTIPSIFHGVGVVASDITGIKSDTVLLTIAGQPYNVSVGINLQQGQNFNDGTYGLPCAAIVTDVNGNPVADGTQVTFSLQVSGYVFWELNAGWNESATGGAFACNVYIDTVQKILPFNDYENCNANCVGNPGPAYEDINHDGRRQYDWRVPVEPLHTCSDGAVQFADLDGNGVWDPIEPLNDPVYLNAYHTLQIDSVYYKLLKNKPFPASDSVLLRTLAVMDSQYSAGTHFIPQLGIYAYDFSWAAQPYPQPPSAASITRTIQTVSGKAVNQIIYGQSIANRIQVTITAESQGIITQFPAQEVLPVVGGAASN